jgi:hypothetical protein
MIVKRRMLPVAAAGLVSILPFLSSPSYASGNSNIWWDTTDTVNCTSCASLVGVQAWTVASGKGAPFEVGIVATDNCNNWTQDESTSYTLNGYWI